MWENCHDYDPKVEQTLASLNQSANEAANRPHPDTLAARLANLEAEVATLRAEVQMLRAGQLRIVDLRRSAAIFDTDFICK